MLQLIRSCFEKVLRWIVMAYFVLYKSRAVQPGDINENTASIAKEAAAKNRNRGITGFLHIENGGFYQYIEGSEKDVKRLYSNICRDPRHYSVVQICNGKTDERRFPDFEMGFASAHGRKIAQSYSDKKQEPKAQDIIDLMEQSRDSMG